MLYVGVKIIVRISSALAVPQHLKFHSDFETHTEHSDLYLKHYIDCLLLKSCMLETKTEYSLFSRLSQCAGCKPQNNVSLLSGLSSRDITETVRAYKLLLHGSVI